MAKPKMAMIPSTVGGSVYSVLPSNGDGDFNFSRASAATRINAQGLIETVAVGDNRLNYPLLDGTVQTCPHLLLEGQRTNLITYSESFSNVYWTKIGSTITSNAAISPDGTLNADKLVEDTSTGTHRVDSIEWIFITGGTTVTQSVYVKANGRTIVGLQDNALGAGYAVFNLSTVTVLGFYGVSAKIETLSDGWFRISYTFVSGGVGSQPYKTGIYALDTYTTGAPLSNTYTGDGTSGVYIWGAQLEEGSYSTSYIVSNSGSATTRIAEVCNGSGNASTFNDSEGVLMAQIGALGNVGAYRLISVAKDGSNVIYIGYTPISNQILSEVYVGGALQASLTYTVTDATALHKVAVKYKVNDFALWVDGVERATDVSGSVFMANTLDEIALDDGAGTNIFYGKTKQLQYFDSALTDSELETLTSWMSFSDMAIDLNYTIQ